MKFAEAAERRVSELTAQEIANTAWAFAKAGQSDKRLLAALGRAAERRMIEFNKQDITNTAWAFAKAVHLDPVLFRVSSLAFRQPLFFFTRLFFCSCSEQSFRFQISGGILGED